MSDQWTYICGEGVWEFRTADGDYVDVYDVEVEGLLELLTADGPVFPADGSLAVIRTEWLHNLFVKWVNGEEPTCEDVCLVRCQGPCEGRAAALLAAPAPADPKEDGDE